MSRTVAELPTHQIPEHIAARLTQLMHRIRAVAAAKGAACTVGAFLTSMLAAVGLDVFVPMVHPASAMWFTPTTRLVTTLTALAVTGVVAVFMLLRPLRHRCSLTAAAMALEREHPELQERISTTVELMLSDDPPVFRGSEQMIQQVALAADADSVRVSPKEVVKSRPAARAWSLAGLVVLVVAGAAALYPETFSLYVQRFAMPWNETAQFRRTRVECLTGDRTVPRMEQLIIEARSSGLRASQATMYVRYADGRGYATNAAAEPAPADGSGESAFRFVIPRVQSGFTYRIRANDGVTEPFNITAVDRPQVARLDLAFDYPDYTGLPDRAEGNALGAIKALRFTTATVRVLTNRELDAADSFLVLDVGGSAQTRPEERRLGLTRIGPNCYQASFQVADPGQYWFDLRSGDLASLLTADRRYPVLPEPDSPPQVSILQPAGQVSLRPDDKLPIAYEASDDFGLSRVQVSYSVDGGPAQVMPVEPPAGSGKRIKAQAVFDLGGLGVDLSAALRVDYVVQVADNLPAGFGGPQWATSSRQQVLIDPKVSDYQSRMTETLREGFADEVARIDKELRAALADVQSVMKAMARQPMMDAEQGRHTDSAVGHLTTANDLALAAAGKTEFSNYQRMGQRLREIATGHVQPARQLAGQSKELADQPDPRKDKLVQAEWHIQRALEKLSAVGQEFTDLISLEQKADKLFEMARKQDEIADKAADAEITDPNELAKLSKEQLELLEQARQMLKADREEAAEPLFDIAIRAEKTLNEKIQEIAQAQKNLAEQTRQAQDLAELEKRAADLARRQADLGKATAQFEKDKAEPLARADAPRHADRPMEAAAEQIRRHEFPQAVAQQRAATTQLDQVQRKATTQAEELLARPENTSAAIYKQRRDEAALKQMAAKARELQQQQQDLAKRTQEAKAAADQVRPQAEAARQQADRQLADLAKKQQEIADQAEQLQKDTAAKLSPSDVQSAKQRDAAPPARQAAEQLRKQAPAAAAPLGQQAEQKARQLAEAMGQAARAHQQAAQQAAQQAEAATEPQARQAAQDRADQENRQAAAAGQIGEKARQLADRQAEVNRQLPQAQQAVADAAQAGAQADKPRQALADLAKKQQNLAAETDRLQKQMTDTSEPSGKLAAEHDAAAPAAEAAGKLPAEPQAAVRPQQKAAEQLGELAKGLDELSGKAAERAARAEQAQKQAQADRQAAAGAAALKQRQEQLAEETRKLGDEFDKARQGLMDRQLAELAREQRDLAEQAANLADSVARQPPDAAGRPQPDQPNPAATRGAQAAQAAAEQLAQRDLPAANAQQNQAAGRLEDLAGQMARQAGQQAGTNPQGQQMAAAQAAQAGRLAERQRQLAEQVANLAKSEPRANLPVRQEALRQDTQQLGEQARMVADFLQDLAPAAGELARQGAAQLAEKAPAAQAQAAQALRQEQLPQARAAQQAAAAAAERAEELFEQAAQQAAAAAEPGGPQEAAEPAAEPGEPGEAAAAQEPNPLDPLAEAAWAQAQARAALRQAAAAQQAGQQLAQALAQAQAAASAQQAGQQLSQAAQAASQQVTSFASMQPGQPGEVTHLYRPAWVSRFGSMAGAPDLRRLNFELGITSSEWNRLPGYIQQEIIQASRENVPQEYRELVKRYFQSISQQAGQK